MKLFEFLESRYITKNLELQQNFSLKTQGEIQAGQALINGTRNFYRMLAYPKLLFIFLMVKLHIVKRPQTAKEITDKIQEDQRQLQAAAAAAQAKQKEDAAASNG